MTKHEKNILALLDKLIVELRRDNKVSASTMKRAQIVLNKLEAKPEKKQPQKPAAGDKKKETTKRASIPSMQDKPKAQKKKSLTIKSIRSKHVLMKKAPGSAGWFCKHCKQQTSEKDWPRHVLTEHLVHVDKEDKPLLRQFVRNPNRKAKRAKKNKKPSTNRSTNQTSARYTSGTMAKDQRAEERRLDGSPGREFRENGRFGSHSLHDDYGGESRP